MYFVLYEIMDQWHNKAIPEDRAILRPQYITQKHEATKEQAAKERATKERELEEALRLRQVQI